MKDRHLITVDELRAAGAIDVPAAWRKSLGGTREPVQRDLFSDLCEEDTSRSDKQPSTPPDQDGDASADELR